MKRIICFFAVLLLSFITFSSCNSENNDKSDIVFTGIIPEDLPSFEGITLKTELEYYAEGTVRILAFWENNSEISLTYGTSWQLKKYNSKTKRWQVVNQGKGGSFEDIGIILMPEWRRKHTYYINIFDENITEGYYRIRTDYIIDGNNDVNERQYGISAEFNITSNESLLRKSELDFDDLENHREIFIGYVNKDFNNIYIKENEFPVHVYKNKKTYDTTIVINGDEQYHIAKGDGKWGIVTCSFYTVDKNKYLIYSYSREDNNEHCSYMGIFDLLTKKETFQSEAYGKYDITINYRLEKDIFEANYMNYEEFENGGIRASSAPGTIGTIGYFKYEDGELKFYKG